MRHSVLPTLLLLCALLLDVKAAKKCRNLGKDKLVPDYVEKVTPQCAVKFSKGVSAKCGNELLPGVTSTEPTIKFMLCKRDCRNATVIVMDPDAMSLAPYLHMLSSNVPIRCLKKGYNSNSCKAGDLQASYVSPMGPGHRYLFCVFCQKKYIEPHQYSILSDFRVGFNMKEYARNQSLSIKACNYFKLKSVPVVSDLLS